MVSQILTNPTLGCTCACMHAPVRMHAHTHTHTRSDTRTRVRTYANIIIFICPPQLSGDKSQPLVSESTFRLKASEACSQEEWRNYTDVETRQFLEAWTEGGQRSYTCAYTSRHVHKKHCCKLHKVHQATAFITISHTTMSLSHSQSNIHRVKKTAHWIDSNCTQ